MTRRIAVFLAIALTASPLIAEPISHEVRAQVLQVADKAGVPRSIADRLQIEESGDPTTTGPASWGDALAVGAITKSGYRSLGLVQLYTEPKNLTWLIAHYWTPFHPSEIFDIFNPLHNAEVGLRYLAALHRRLLTWERALWYYNCGRVTDVPESTRQYAARIVAWPGKVRAEAPEALRENRKQKEARE
jgi:hypothetical protein